MEGMASYYAEDESTADKMFLTDAVVNDSIPSIAQGSVGGFFAYRFGHATFDYMEERWGSDGVLDFLYEFRNTLGARIEPALKQAFRIDAEDFDADFRKWLRKKYLSSFVETGEPSDFGRRYRWENSPSSQATSPVVSPSGDLVAAIGTPDGALDVVLYDAKKRRSVRNLTKGYEKGIMYFSAQHLSIGRREGRDLAFSPDGNFVAVFAKREEGRSLLLIDVLKGGVDRVIPVSVEQPFAPAWHPSKNEVAFAGNENGHFDIFVMDLESLEVQNLTNDDRYDSGPAYAPDGESLVFSSEVGEFYKLFRLNADGNGERVQITSGSYNDIDPSFMPDGTQLFFTSDRNGFDNIYGLNLETKGLKRYTNTNTGAFQPAVIARADGDRELVYTGYWRSRFDLYRIDLNDPIEEPIVIEEPETEEIVLSEKDIERFEPDILVTVDEDKKEDYRGWKLHLDDAGVNVGVTDDQLFQSTSYLSFSDLLGDKRFIATYASISNFSAFSATYIDQSKRWQWGASVYDNRTFFLSYQEPGNQFSGVERDQLAFRQTGATFFTTYPFDFSHRAELGLGFVLQKYDFQAFARDQDGNNIPVIQPREDEYPFLNASFIGDSAIYAPWGAISGRRYSIRGSYAPDTDAGGTLTSSISLDWRQYFTVTKRSNFAIRVFAGASFGNFPNVFYFGGSDDFRASDFRAFSGDRAFYTNIEYRFPLIDQLWFPFLRFQGIRGRIFLDVAGSWFDYAGQDFDFWDSENNRLQDAVSDYGWGVTIRFIGFDMHWDFAKRWDGDTTFDDSIRTNFWIGARF